jgi:organic radical activating enzyme
MSKPKNKTRIQVPISVIVTDYCNRICGPCSESATKDKSKAKFLNLELFKKEFAGLEGDKKAPLMFSGGEPYLHPEFDNSFTTYFSNDFEDIIICTK